MKIILIFVNIPYEAGNALESIFVILQPCHNSLIAFIALFEYFSPSGERKNKSILNLRP